MLRLGNLTVLRSQRQARYFAAAAAASGRVTQVIGAVVDVAFEGEIPKVRAQCNRYPKQTNLDVE